VAPPIIRSSSSEFFRTRAEQARAEGEAAMLNHVRERCHRSEAAWTALAEKAARGEQLRVAEAERKARQEP
jgi:hypothetical protein